MSAKTWTAAEVQKLILDEINAFRAHAFEQGKKPDVVEMAECLYLALDKECLIEHTP